MTILAARETRSALADLSARFWCDPSSRLRLYGITGTNGKTTSAWLLSAILRAAGQSTGVIGTLGASLDGEPLPSDRTTPEANDLQRLLATMVERGADAAAMEVSSHALALGRVGGIRFSGALFTNWTQDHLDFHGSLEEYFQAKALLFTEYASQPGFQSVLNIDDEGGRRLVSTAGGRVTTYGVSTGAMVRAESVESGESGSTFKLVSPWGSGEVRLRLLGGFNVLNALGVAALSLALEIPFEVVVGALDSSCGALGRFERVDGAPGFGVVVDYAHTPDGLSNVLRSARGIASNRVSVVFGCGGDRDPGKRPIMGRIAGDLADLVVVTSDNPRSESPDSIVSQILDGISADSKARVEAIVDRREAIFHAIREAKPGDLVIVAGKGHEDYQIFADRTVHFDDREVAQEAIDAIL